MAVRSDNFVILGTPQFSGALGQGSLQNVPEKLQA